MQLYYIIEKNLPDIPNVTFTRLYGFIDILNHMGGKADVAAISSKEQLELDDILAILETGQMLGFIQVKSGDISITERGYSILSASPTQQKLMLRETLMNLRPFQKLVLLIKQSKTGYITKQKLLEYNTSTSRDSNSKNVNNDKNESYDLANDFDWIIGWGRMALLIDYNSDNETVRLRNDDVNVVSPVFVSKDDAIKSTLFYFRHHFHFVLLF